MTSGDAQCEVVVWEKWDVWGGVDIRANEGAKGGGGGLISNKWFFWSKVHWGCYCPGPLPWFRKF